MRHRVHRIVRLALPALFLGCGAFSEVKDLTKNDTKAPQTLEPHDPNYIAEEAAINAGSTLTPVAHSARTTLLEENEHLRDLLAKALADRRACEQRFTESEIKNGTLASKITELEDSVTRLSEEVDAANHKVASLETAKVRLEKERATLAEMYALEKRQRLAFEKELLEREIRNRTLTKDG